MKFLIVRIRMFSQVETLEKAVDRRGKRSLHQTDWKIDIKRETI